MAPEGEGAAADMPDDTPEAPGGLGQGGSSYVPPHLRGRGGAGEKMGGKYERDDLATLRVTNVRIIQHFTLLRRTCIDKIRRSPNSPKNRISGKCSADSAMLRGCSWPRTGKLVAQRASLSSVTQIGQMQRRLARRWMDVSRLGLRLSATQKKLTIHLDGFGHLILRVEFAKKAT